ncbi:MAG: low molecular weight phosphotyrosine protein phosphatase [Anaerolineales bacterium]
MDKKRILFVCEGNIIRSPLAENLFTYLLDEAGLSDQYEADSAGTAAYHVGEQPDSRMRQVAAKNGLHYTGMARQFQVSDFDEFDLIIPQDMRNFRNLQQKARTQVDEAKLVSMRTFDPQGNSTDGVPDPYYGGIDGFQETFAIVQRSCQGLLDALMKGEVNL